MKSLFLGKYLKNLFAILAMFSGIGLAKADSIVLVADTWCPYNCSSQSKPGIIVEVAREIFSEAGHRIVWRPTPYSRALKMVRQGKAAGVPGAYKSDAPDFVFPKKHVVVSTNAFHVNADSQWHFEGLYSLADVSFGIVQDFTFGDPIDSYINANRYSGRVIRLGGRMANMRLVTMLHAKRIDAVLEDPHVFRYWADQTEYETTTKTVGASFSEYSYIAFSPRNPKSREYADILDRGLEKLRMSGRMNKITQRYGIRELDAPCCDVGTAVATR